MANVLPFEKQIECIAALTEGVSIRATERLTGVHRDTIMRLDVIAVVNKKPHRLTFDDFRRL